MKILLCLLALITCTSAQAEQVLRFLSWQDYFDPAVLEDFQQSTGIRVDYQGFTTAQELMPVSYTHLTLPTKRIV